MNAPPSRTAWRIESELKGGHSVNEVLGYLSACADYEDQVLLRALPDFIIFRRLASRDGAGCSAEDDGA